MAQDAVDVAVRHAGLAAAPCRTHSLALIGAPGTSGAPPSGMDELLWAGVVARHGSEARRVLDVARPRSAAAAVGHLRIARAEIEWAVTHEGALDADDVLDRRTRIGLVPTDRAALAEEVEKIVTTR